jgi:hypothetical protein
MPHGITAHIVPLFAVALARAKHMIEELLLPDRSRYVDLALNRFARPFFPKPKEYWKCFGIQLRCAEKVNMIRHDHVPTNGPAVTLTRRGTLADQDHCDFSARENCFPLISARGDKVDWVVDPNSLKPLKMLVHAQL